MHDVVERRIIERKGLIARADQYVRDLAKDLDLTAAVVVGSVARGDFNVWSDIDVIVIAEALPSRYPERSALLFEHARGGIQPIGFVPAEFALALCKRNPLAVEAVEKGVILAGGDFLQQVQ